MTEFSKRRQIMALLAIIALAAFFRFYLITEIPPGLYPDEAANGNNAVEALRTGAFKLFYPENNGREGLFINLQALAIALLGREPWVLRSVSALFGALTVLGIYLAAKELFLEKSEARNTKSETNSKIRISKFEFRIFYIPLLSSFFLAASFWHINFSRIGFRAIMVPFFAVFAMYWLLKALRTGKISSAIAAGIAAGLGFHTYIGFRFMPFVFAVPIIFSFLAWRRGRIKHCAPCSITLFLFIAFVAALPLGFYFLEHPADFAGRSGQVSIFSADSPLAEFAKSNLLTAGMLFIRGDCNPRHNLACQPQLFWPVGILFLLGFLLVIWSSIFGGEKSEARNTKSETNSKIRISKFEFRISRDAALALLAWLIFMSLPATLTREGLPHALRAIGMIPPVMIIAAMGGVWLWRSLNAYFDGALINPEYAAYRGQLERIKKELAIAAILILILIPAYAYRDYFVRFAYSPATADAFAADLLEKGRLLRMLPAETEKIILVNMPGQNIRGVPAPAQTVMFASDTFDETERAKARVSYINSVEKIAVDGSRRTAIIPLNPRDSALLAVIRGKLPFFKARTIGSGTIFQN